MTKASRCAASTRTRIRGRSSTRSIFVNTSHAPIAVSATFCHEFAHYLTAELLKQGRHSLHLFYDAAYTSHLDDPIELIADSSVALQAYPRELALTLFKTPWNWGLVGRIGSLPGDGFEQSPGGLQAVQRLRLSSPSFPRFRTCTIFAE